MINLGKVSTETKSDKIFGQEFAGSVQPQSL